MLLLISNEIIKVMIDHLYVLTTNQFYSEFMSQLSPSVFACSFTIWLLFFTSSPSPCSVPGASSKIVAFAVTFLERSQIRIGPKSS